VVRCDQIVGDRHDEPASVASAKEPVVDSSLGSTGVAGDARFIQNEHLGHVPKLPRLHFDDLLSETCLVRIQGRRPADERLLVKVHEILDEVTSITSTFASEKNLSLYIEPDSDQNVEIVADRTRLRQVMINLVNNAIKFTEKGHIAIRVDKKADENILISVQDTGIGIPQDKLEVIFQEFTQVDISSTRKAGGTGLGLPISRRLVGMHGGALWAESAGLPGEGSTFFVRLPLVARITDVVEKQEK